MPRRNKPRILVLDRELARQDFAQLEALHFAGRGARQLVDCAHPLRTLVARQQALARFLGGALRGGRIGARGHEKREALQSISIRHRHARRLRDRGLLRRDRFQFAGLHPLAGDLEELVGSALVDVVAIRVAHEEITAAEPAVAELRFSLARKIGIAGGLRRMPDPEEARLSRGWRMAARVAQFNLYPLERGAGAYSIRGA